MKKDSDFTFTLSVSIENYDCKPQNKELERCVFIPHQLTVTTALQCATNGKAFCYSFQTNNSKGYLPIKKKTKANFIGTSTFIYDFDGMSVDMSSYIEQIPYKPSFAYTTYSNGVNGESRFRLAYVFDDNINGEGGFNEIYYAIATANQFVKETKDTGGWDVRSVAQMYYGTTSQAATYKSDYIYNTSDFEKFAIPFKPVTKTSHSRELNMSKYKAIDATFLEDFNTLVYNDFFKKYYDSFYDNYNASLESALILSANEMWYEFPEEYFVVPRKRNGRLTLRWNIGEDRKKKLYMTAQLMLHNVYDLTLENLIYGLAIERKYYYDNSDNKIDNRVLIETAINAFNKRATLKPSKHGSFKVNKEFWNDQGIGVRQAVGYVKRMRKVQELLPYIDFTKSLPQNHKNLLDKGVNISLRTLQRMVARGDFSIVMDADCFILSQCHDAINRSEILELIKTNNTITITEIANTLGINKSTVQRNINKMRGVFIEREGNNRTGHWIVIEDKVPKVPKL